MPQSYFGLREQQHRMKRKGETSCLDGNQVNPPGTLCDIPCNFAQVGSRLMAAD